jgi:hypothetical protein
MSRGRSNFEEMDEEIDDLDKLEAYIKASEMYLEAFNSPEKVGTDLYNIGMVAVYFGKAYVEFGFSENEAAMKESLKESIGAYTLLFSLCKSYMGQSHTPLMSDTGSSRLFHKSIELISNTSKLIIDDMTKELRKMK